MKVFVSTHPFSSTSNEPMNLLKKNGFEVVLNPKQHKITSEELARYIKDADILIAGTERINKEVFDNAPNLKLISRVGIGLDGIDFNLCKKYKVKVAYTPDAPTIAVAELCVGMIFDLLRKITYANNNLKQNGIWQRYMGTLLRGKSVGIIGLGRIGKSLMHFLSNFGVHFKVCDVDMDISYARLYDAQILTKEELLSSSDIVSLNLPLKKDTFNFMTKKELSLMKKEAILINTARGEIVNENDLYEALKNGAIAGAGVDVFSQEPYSGKLLELDNCILTCHMGASTKESRADMETQAVLEAIRFKNKEALKNEVFENE